MSSVSLSRVERTYSCRSGRVTASNMKRLKDNKDPSSLVRTVMGYTGTQLSNHAVKHGVSMEPHAKNMFVHLMKRSHKGFSARDCGLGPSPV